MDLEDMVIYGFAFVLPIIFPILRHFYHLIRSVKGHASLEDSELWSTRFLLCTYFVRFGGLLLPIWRTIFNLIGSGKEYSSSEENDLEED